MILPNGITLSPGSRARLIVTTAKSEELILLDVENPAFETEDDGSEGKPSGKLWYLRFHCDFGFSRKEVGDDV